MQRRHSSAIKKRNAKSIDIAFIYVGWALRPYWRWRRHRRLPSMGIRKY